MSARFFAPMTPRRIECGPSPLRDGVATRAERKRPGLPFVTQTRPREDLMRLFSVSALAAAALIT
ncbi:MAG: hypothetical protein KDK22_08385, partial [Rhodobacteraceae bacterium]|nr:hypothetical protein [Paracoccaceae bacterium]